MKCLYVRITRHPGLEPGQAMGAKVLAQYDPETQVCTVPPGEYWGILVDQFIVLESGEEIREGVSYEFEGVE